MSKTYNKQEQELYKRIDEVIHYIWDPIGIAGEPYARDEYDSYLPQVFSLVCSNNNATEIADRLTILECEILDTNPRKAAWNRAAAKRNHKVAEILLAWRDKILEDDC